MIIIIRGGQYQLVLIHGHIRTKLFSKGLVRI